MATNEYAVVVYNSTTGLAQTVTIQASAPTSTSSSTVGLSSIAIMPVSPPSLAIGSAQQFVATGAYSNATTQNITAQVTWASSNSAVATISAGGLVTGVGVGSTVITASLSGVTSPPVTLTVTATATSATLTSIEVVPAPAAHLQVGSTLQFTAIGAYSDGTRQTITSIVNWTSSNTAIATIASSGLATGVAAGSTVITASLSGVTSQSVTLTVGSSGFGHY